MVLTTFRTKDHPGLFDEVHDDRQLVDTDNFVSYLAMNRCNNTVAYELIWFQCFWTEDVDRSRTVCRSVRKPTSSRGTQLLLSIHVVSLTFFRLGFQGPTCKFTDSRIDAWGTRDS